MLKPLPLTWSESPLSLPHDSGALFQRLPMSNDVRRSDVVGAVGAGSQAAAGGGQAGGGGEAARGGRHCRCCSLQRQRPRANPNPDTVMMSNTSWTKACQRSDWHDHDHARSRTAERRERGSEERCLSWRASGRSAPRRSGRCRRRLSAAAEVSLLQSSTSPELTQTRTNSNRTVESRLESDSNGLGPIMISMRRSSLSSDRDRRYEFERNGTDPGHARRATECML
eukprot:883486-Rhodomonas_salina.1